MNKYLHKPFFYNRCRFNHIKNSFAFIVKINKTHVMFDVSVANEIQNKYNEIYGSGIVVAKGKLIT